MTTAPSSSSRQRRRPGLYTATAAITILSSCIATSSSGETAAETIAATLSTECQNCEEETNPNIDYGNHNLNWEDGPASWEEFGHDNAPDVCGVPRLTVEEWEAGRYWVDTGP